jgi:hypothetical protein
LDPVPNRRFPPPWTVEEANNACFVVKDVNGFAEIKDDEKCR